MTPCSRPPVCRREFFLRLSGLGCREAFCLFFNTCKENRRAVLTEKDEKAAGKGWFVPDDLIPNLLLSAEYSHRYCANSHIYFLFSTTISKFLYFCATFEKPCLNSFVERAGLQSD